jgi:toluene monooxygenase system ferredoxin subunit
MAFKKVCALSDLWEGDMSPFEVDGQDVLLVWPEGEEIPRAYQGECPHQAIPLHEGSFDGKVLTCRAHQWEFDTCTGKGLNPEDCRLMQYPLKIEGEDVYVNVEGIEPLHAS